MKPMGKGPRHCGEGKAHGGRRKRGAQRQTSRRTENGLRGDGQAQVQGQTETDFAAREGPGFDGKATRDDGAVFGD